MGRVHKKKIAEYAESAENENEQDETKKSATVESNSEESEVDGGGEEGDDGKKKQSVVRDRTRPEGNTDDEFHSVQGSATDDEQEDGSSGTGGKKANKRKSAPEKLIDGDNDNLDSDDEPLNGGGGGVAKKGRKSTGGGKQKAAGKNGKAGGRRGKGKKAQAKSQVDEGEGEEEGEEVYEVKDIVGHKVEHGVTYYLIRWKGYTKDDDTWEPEDTLSCPNIIEKYKNKQSPNKSSKKSGVAAKKGRPGKGGLAVDPNKEWEVDKIIDYAEEKNQRIFRIRWKGFGPKHDTWEPEANLSCDEIIDKFMKRMKSQENVSFKELREEPKKTKRLVNETSPRTNYHNPIGRKSKRAVSKKRVYYGDSDE